MADAKTEIITNALAEYFDCDPSEIGAFALCCERADEGDSTAFSVAWTALPYWHILGFVDELKYQVEKYRQPQLIGDNNG